LQTQPITQPRPRWRRLAIAALVLAGAIAAWAYWTLYAANSLSGRIAAIRAAGDPATIADLTSKPISRAENAAAHLVAAQLRLNEFAKAHGRFLKSPAGVAFDAADDAGGSIAPEHLAAIRIIVEKYPDLDAAFANAASCERYASPLNFSLPYPQFMAALTDPPIDIRSAARFIAWQMKLASESGQADVALEKGIQLLRLAALYDAEPGLISSQISMAVRGAAVAAIDEALSTGPISPSVHAKLEEELAAFDAQAALLGVLKTERAIAISATQDQIGGAKSIIVNTIGFPTKKLYLGVIDCFEPMLKLAGKPWHVAYEKGTPSVFQEPTGFGMLADLLASSFELQFEILHRTDALLRSLRVKNALRQFAAENGREAKGLDDLALPKEATIDPFSGQPLQLKRIDNGWLIYSVGKDGVDDGGSFDDSKDYGLRPRKSVK
jgi:hypothetical protein